MAPVGAEQLQRVVGSTVGAGVEPALARGGEEKAAALAPDQFLLGGDPDTRLRPGQRTLPGTYDRQGRALREQPEARSNRAPEPQRALNLDEQRVIRQLQARDAEVRAHESAHKSAGGSLSGAASYTYQQGPDGRNYAIGGEVPIRMPASGNAESLARNAQQVRRAALAPAKPSGSDMAIASMATRAEQQARADIRSRQVEEAAQLAAARGAEAPSERSAGEASGAVVGAGVAAPGSIATVPDGSSPSHDLLGGRTLVARTDAEPLPPPRPRPPEPPPEPKAKEPPPRPKEPPPPIEDH